MTNCHRARNEQLQDMSVNMTRLGIIEQLDVRRVIHLCQQSYYSGDSAAKHAPGDPRLVFKYAYVYEDVQEARKG